MQPGAVKLREVHLPSEEQRLYDGKTQQEAQTLWEHNSRLMTLQSCAQVTGKATVLQISRRNLSRHWEAHGQKVSAKSTAGWREQRCLKLGHSAELCGSLQSTAPPLQEMATPLGSL